MDNRILMWSGGSSSTLCLLKELEKYKYSEVWSFDWTMNDLIKRLSEEKARENFKNNYHNNKLKIDHNVIKLKHRPISISKNQVELIDLIIQLSILLVPTKTTLIFGFTLDNYLWKFSKFIEDQAKHLQKEIYVETPLSQISEYKVFEEVKKFEFNFWDCESPDVIGEECGKCSKCLKNKSFIENMK